MTKHSSFSTKNMMTATLAACLIVVSLQAGRADLTQAQAISALTEYLNNNPPVPLASRGTVTSHPGDAPILVQHQPDAHNGNKVWAAEWTKLYSFPPQGFPLEIAYNPATPTMLGEYEIYYALDNGDGTARIAYKAYSKVEVVDESIVGGSNEGNPHQLIVWHAGTSVITPETVVSTIPTGMNPTGAVVSPAFVRLGTSVSVEFSLH